MKRSIPLLAIIGTLLLIGGALAYAAHLHDKGETFTNIAVFHDDIRYCQSSHPNLEMDIHVPKTASTSAPAPYVFYVHGGGWKEGSFRNNIDDYYPRFLIKEGIAFITVDYRLVPEATYPAQNNDIACAYAYLQTHAAKYNLDPTRVGVMGDSAGGQLASMEALKSKNKDSVQALATFYGVSDLWYQITENNSKTAIAYLGERDESLAKKASPYYTPLPDKLPGLFIHGTKDSLVTIQNSQRQYERFKKYGAPATLLPVEGAGHGFGDNAGSKAQAFVQPALTQFFKDHLLKTE